MILYRDVTYEEFEQITSGKKIATGNNYNGMHFFKYFQHAKMYLSCYGQMIIECDIPEYLIKEIDYVKFYPYKSFEVGVPIPECIINKDDFDYSFIRSTNPKKNQIPNYNDGKLYNKFLSDEFKKWKKNNANYANDKYGFYDYVTDYLKGKNLDDFLFSYAEKKNAKRLVRLL